MTKSNHIRLLLGMLLFVSGMLFVQPSSSQADDQKVAAAVKAADEMAQAGPFKPTWDSLEGYQIPKWYKNAKFGIFIHWGVYCVPAFGNEWYPRNMYIDNDSWRGNYFDHHKETYGPQKNFGYKDFIPQLTAAKFDPQEWAQLFKDAGARYIVPVAEHHDGFPMYDCSYTEWNAAKMGPKRDIIGDLSKAVRAEGMRFGVSSHRAFNWAFYKRSKDFDTSDPKNFGLYGPDLDYLYTKEMEDYGKNPWPPHTTEFKDNWLARTSELVTKYNPDLIWFDFGIAPGTVKAYNQNPYADHLKRFTSFYYNWAAKNKKSAIINYKFNAFPEKAAVLDLERSKMDAIRRPFWQTDTAVSNNSWGYVANQNYKTVDRLVDDLIDIVSKNGCLLLNIGPKADGTIPVHEQEMLRDIGKWLKINGEAIYSTRPWKIYGEGPTGTATGHLSENKNKAFGAQDIRFTRKGKKLYAIPLAWPENGIVSVKSLKTDSELYAKDITSVKLLGSDAEIKWERTKEGLKATLPETKPCENAFVLIVE